MSTPSLPPTVDAAAGDHSPTAKRSGRSLRLEKLATPTRPVPFTATLLRRTQHQTKSGSTTSFPSLTASLSSPALPALVFPRSPLGSDDDRGGRSPADEGSPPSTKSPPMYSTYKRHCPPVWGGLEYRREQRKNSVASKFFDCYSSEAKSLDAHRARERRRDQRNRKRRMMEATMRRDVEGFAAVDANHDGKLSYEEFCELVESHLLPRRKRRAVNTSAHSRARRKGS